MAVSSLGSSSSGGGSFSRNVFKRLGDSEIRNDDWRVVGFGFVNDVFRFEVSVDDTIGVEIGCGEEDLAVGVSA